MKSKGLKIATIGGGSSYTPELVEGLIKRHHELPVRELWLVDIEAGKEKLEIVGNLAKRMVKRAGIPMKIHLTLQREKALEGADFVTTQIRVGGLDARKKDEEIPLKYGVIGQETVGAGGMLKALRTIPVLLEIAAEMKRLCPDAWLINFTNPAGLVTEALLRYSEHSKTIGVCNLPVHTRNSISQLLNVPKEKVCIDFAGLNHLVYGLNVWLEEENVTQKVLRLFALPENQLTMKNIMPLPWQPEFLQALGVIPCPYHRYYYKSQEILQQQIDLYQQGITRAKVVKQLEEDLFQLYQNPDLDIKPPQLEKRGGAYYSDAACNLISSIYNDKRDIQTLNVQNGGAISGIPASSAVEINCIVGKEGPEPVAVGKLPIAVHGLVQEIKSFEILTAEAAVTGSYEKGLLALSIHPLTPSEQVAKNLLDEMLAAHREYLPQFFSAKEGNR